MSKIVPCFYKIIKHISISVVNQNHHAYHGTDLSTPRLDPRTQSNPYPEQSSLAAKSHHSCESSQSSEAPEHLVTWLLSNLFSCLCAHHLGQQAQALTILPRMKAWRFIRSLAGLPTDKTLVGSFSYLYKRRLTCITSSSLKPSIQLSPIPRAPHTSALPPCFLETAMKALSTWYPSVYMSET